MNMTIEIIIHACISIFCAFIIFLVLDNWGIDFQFPLIRSPKNHPPYIYTASSAFAIYALYVFTGWIIYYGFALPLMPDTKEGIFANLDSFDLAIAGIILVAVIRLLTLINSVDSYQTLLHAVTIAAGFSFFVSFREPNAIQKSIEAAIANSDGKQLLIPLISIILLGVTDIVWFGWIRYKKPLKASQTFVDR